MEVLRNETNLIYLTLQKCALRLNEILKAFEGVLYQLLQHTKNNLGPPFCSLPLKII